MRFGKSPSLLLQKDLKDLLKINDLVVDKNGMLLDWDGAVIVGFADDGPVVVTLIDL